MLVDGDQKGPSIFLLLDHGKMQDTFYEWSPKLSAIFI